jgi:hypothetical protein
MSDFIVKPFSSITEKEKEQFYIFCKNASQEKDPAADNMWADNWESHGHTLPYLLEIEGRFTPPTGEFFIVFCNTQVVACGGIYVSNFDSLVSIAGVRTWINKEFRNLQIARNYLLPAQKAWSIEFGHKAIALTFNKYNKNIIETFARTRLGEDANRMKTRKPHHLFYNGVNRIDFSVNIQFTEQWLIYELLDQRWSYDWTKIKFIEEYNV